MTSTEKIPRRSVFKKAVVIPFGFMLVAFTIHKPSLINSYSQVTINDTLPQTEIFNLKRKDINVVIFFMDSGMVKIRLKNKDSIMMNQADFDTLPAKIKKEISAHNDGLFSSEQIESSYPGGPSGWMNYLNRTFKYPQDAIKSSIQGTVVVQFIVDEQGKVSGIEAISGPTSGGLREETIRVMQRSGRWTPASWNGYKVKSYKRQPLTFRLTP